MKSKPKKPKTKNKSSQNYQLNTRPTNPLNYLEEYLDNSSSSPEHALQMITQNTFHQLIRSFKKNIQERPKYISMVLACTKYESLCKKLVFFHKNGFSILIEGVQYINEMLGLQYINWCKQMSLSLRAVEVASIFQKLENNSDSKFLWVTLQTICDQIHSQYESIKDGPEKKINQCRELCLMLTKYLLIRKIPDSCSINTLFQPFQAYIEVQIVTLDVIDRSHSGLPFIWAINSLLSQKNREFFRKIMEYFQNGWSKESSQATVGNFLFQSLTSDKISNNSKLLVIHFYCKTLLKIIENTNFEYNLSELSVELILNNLFLLAELCHKIKSFQSLSSLVAQIEKQFQIKIQDLDPKKQSKCMVQACQLSLYKVLISIEKCLPNYPLRYYLDKFINKPHFFHLYFFDDILSKRQPTEVKELMVGLTEKWINYELRQFNMLSYVCKFVRTYLTRKNTVQTLYSYFQALSLESLIALNDLIFRNSFPSISRMQTHSSVPETLSKYHFSSFTKACGYASKSLWVDRLFYIAPQLLCFEVILRELVDDSFYYSVKHFYYTLKYSFEQESHETAKEKIDGLIRKWQMSLKKSYLIEFCSIFQIFLNMEKLNSEHQKQIIEIIFVQSEQIQNLYSRTIQARRECLKQMSLSPSEVTEYLSEEEKLKKYYDYMMKGMMKLIEMMGIKIQEYVPHFLTFEHVISILDNFSKTSGISGHRSARILSVKAGTNIFSERALKSVGGQKITITKCQIIRQYFFAFIQCQRQEEFESLNKITNPKGAFLFCLSMLNEEINHMNESEYLKCKFVILETLLEVMSNIWESANINVLKPVFQREKSEIRELLMRILEKDQKIVGRYERKLTLHLRSLVIKFLCSEACQQISLFHFYEIWIIIFHLSMDEDVEIRFQLFGSLTSQYNENSKKLRSQGYFCIVILTLMESLDPKSRLKLSASRILKVYESALNMKSIPIILLSMLFLFENCCWALPYSQILSKFADTWMKNKQTQYLLYSTIEEMQKRAYLFTKFPNFSVLIKPYKINSKMKNFDENREIEREQKMHRTKEIVECFKRVVQQKSRRYRFLKSKKDVYVDWGELQKIGFITCK